MSITADLEDVFGLVAKLARTVLAGDTLHEFELALAAFDTDHPLAAVHDVAEGVADATGPDVSTGTAPAPTTPVEPAPAE